VNGTRGLLIATAAAFIVGCSVGLMGGMLFMHFGPGMHGGPGGRFGSSGRFERRGCGLNLTHETLDVMMRHSGRLIDPGMSQEAWLLRYTDKFSYIFHDVNDIFVRMRRPMQSELKNLVNLFGENQRERTTTVISGLVIESAECKRVSFELSELGRMFSKLRDLMYEIYPHVTRQNVAECMEKIYDFLTMLSIGDPYLLLALMTDKDALLIANSVMSDQDLFNQTALCEISPHLEEIGKVDLCDPCLDW